MLVGFERQPPEGVVGERREVGIEHQRHGFAQAVVVDLATGQGALEAEPLVDRSQDGGMVAPQLGAVVGLDGDPSAAFGEDDLHELSDRGPGGDAARSEHDVDPLLAVVQVVVADPYQLAAVLVAVGPERDHAGVVACRDVTGEQARGKVFGLEFAATPNRVVEACWVRPAHLVVAPHRVVEADPLGGDLVFVPVGVKLADVLELGGHHHTGERRTGSCTAVLVERFGDGASVGFEVQPHQRLGAVEHVDGPVDQVHDLFAVGDGVLAGGFGYHPDDFGERGWGHVGGEGTTKRRPLPRTMISSNGSVSVVAMR